MIPPPGAASPRPSRPIWLVTFTDLVALLLAFFVMLFATQRVEQHKWKSLVDALSQALVPPVEEASRAPSADSNVAQMSPHRASDLVYLEALLKDFLASDPALRGVTLRRLEGRIALGLPSAAIFRPGDARIGEGAVKPLFGIGGILRNIGNAVVVHGHADPEATRGRTYATNWELSLARAAAVARALRDAGYPRNIRAIGYADTRFRDLAPVGPARERYALARRVDIVILEGRIAP